MISNNERTSITNSTESKPIKVNKDMSRNRQESRHIIRTKNEKTAEIQNKTTNANIPCIFSNEEPKTKELIFQHLQKVKNTPNYKNFYRNYKSSNRNSIHEGLIEADNITVFKLPLKKSYIKELTDGTKDNENKENTDKNSKKNNTKYNFFQNRDSNDNDEPIKIKNETSNHKYNKIKKLRKYNYNDSSITTNNNTYYKYKTNDEESSIKKYINDYDENLSNINNNNNCKNIEKNNNNNNIDNYFNNHIYLYPRTNNNTMDSNELYSLQNISVRNNNNKSITDKLLCKITKKLNIPKPLSYKKKSLNAIDDHKTKTLNSFYIKKKQSTNSVNEENNNLNNKTSDFNEPNIKINENNNKNNNNNSINKTIDNKKNIRKKFNNKIRILNSGKAISLVESENEDFIDKNKVDNNDNENKINYMTLNPEIIEKNSSKYYFTNTRNTPSVINNKLNKNRSNNNSNNSSVKYFSQRNFYNKNKCNDDELKDEDILTDRSNNFKNKYNIDLYNDNDFVSNGTFLDNFKVNNNKILFKKKKMNEIRIKNESYKKFQNVKYIEEKDKEKNSQRKTNNKESVIKKIYDSKNVNKSNKYTIINNFSEYSNKIRSVFKHNFYPSGRICLKIDPFGNNTPIDQKKDIINKNNSKNSINPLIIIIKKQNGKILSQINTKEDIETINKELQKEKFTINNEPVQFISINNINNIQSNKELILYEENKKLKEENELLSRKEKLDDDLIIKLDKEKKDLIEEINKIKKEKNEEKIINEQLMKENEKIKKEIENISNKLNEMVKTNTNKFEEEIFEIGNINGLNFNVDIESINDWQTEKNEEFNDTKEFSLKDKL